MSKDQVSPATDGGKPIEVYYNSACPVCKAGIDGQKGKAASCEIAWRDVHHDNKAATEVASDIEFVRERLHVVDEHGELKVGADAFLALWRNTPQDAWKVRLLGSPLIKPLAIAAYNVFAVALYRWNRWMRHW